MFEYTWRKQDSMSSHLLIVYEQPTDHLSPRLLVIDYNVLHCIVFLGQYLKFILV